MNEGVCEDMNERQFEKTKARSHLHTFTPSYVAAALLLLLSGCFPSSCRRTETRALFASDSLSREIAAQTSVDTLRLAWETVGGEALEYPRTVLFGEGGALYVSDVGGNRLLVFGREGALREEIAGGAFNVPYLAGRQGDTLAVFSAGAGRVDFVVEGEVVRRVEIQAGRPEQVLQYAVLWDGDVYYKAVGEEVDGFVARLDAGGDVEERVALPGPYWRHAGALRAWGDSLLSLSGYRPVADVLTEADGALRIDTMALAGFDSPMLARSRLFALGETYEAPLLTASAAPAGSRLFVLNMRPGWLRVDVYDRTGRLERVLIQENPRVDKNFYPVDLAARQTSDGGYEIAVVAVEPVPRVAVYRVPSFD